MDFQILFCSWSTPQFRFFSEIASSSKKDQRNTFSLRLLADFCKIIFKFNILFVVDCVPNLLFYCCESVTARINFMFFRVCLDKETLEKELNMILMTLNSQTEYIDK